MKKQLISVLAFALAMLVGPTLALLVAGAGIILFEQGKPYVGTFRNDDGILKLSTNGTWTNSDDEKGAYTVDTSSKKIVLSGDSNDEYRYYDHGMWIMKDGGDSPRVSTAAKFNAKNAADIAGKTVSNALFAFTFANDGTLTLDYGNGKTFEGFYLVDKETKTIQGVLDDYETKDLQFTYEVDKKGKVTLKEAWKSSYGHTLEELEEEIRKNLLEPDSLSNVSASQNAGEKTRKLRQSDSLSNVPPQNAGAHD